MSSILTGDKYYSLQELSDSSGISYFRIREYVLNGKVPYITSGNKYMVRAGALSEYLMQLEQKKRG